MDYLRLQTRYQRVSGQSVLAAGDDLSSTARSLVTAKAGYSIYIQQISVNVITDNAATQTFQDDAGTPVVIAKTKASPGIGPLLFNFGVQGRKLTEGQAFTMKNSAAGLAADVHWEGYIKPTGTVQPSGV